MKIYGDLTGRYEAPSGDEMPIKDLKLESDQVTFLLESGSRDLTLRMDFKGKLYGKILLRGELCTKMIKGKLSFEEFTKQVTGRKMD